MGGFYSWIRNIVCFLCIFNILLQILPAESFKKYVRFFGGLILIIMVMEPLADVTHLTENFERAWRLESLREQADGIRITGEGMEELRSEKIREAYQAEVKRQVEEVVRAYGMEPEKTKLEFTQEEEEAACISGVELRVSGEAVSDAGISEIKKELREVYHISEGHINISIQE